MKSIRVLKFGGTSLGDAQTWQKVLEIVRQYERPVVVVSATDHTTRRLMAAAEAALDTYEKSLKLSSEIRTKHEQLVEHFLENHHKNISNEIRNNCMNWIDRQISSLNGYLKQINDTKKLDARLRDAVASTGEQLSSALLAECGRLVDLDTVFVDAREIIKTDSNFGKANPDTTRIRENTERLVTLSKNGSVPITGGYYGENEKGQITTLGFEGSDYTASLIGAALDCEAIEIWTDVSGIYTCDPRVVEQAVSIPEISFREATEMAYFGARVLHPSTLKPAAEKNIPVFVRNVFEPTHPGTKIFENAESDGPVRALTFLEDVVIITVTAAGTLMGYQFLSNVFKILENHHISVDVVVTSEASVSIAMERPAELDAIVVQLKKAGDTSLTEKQGLISLIGFTLTHLDEFTDRVFSSVGEDTPSLISFNRDKRNLTLILPEEEMIRSVRSIHDSLFKQRESY